MHIDASAPIIEEVQVQNDDTPCRGQIANFRRLESSNPITLKHSKMQSMHLKKKTLEATRAKP